jgi:cytochrome c553
MRRSILTIFAAATLAATSMTNAADVAAGKSKAKMCSKCHEPAGDWKGRTEAELATKIAGVASGSATHPKKLTLTEADIANIAAYWATLTKQ